MRHIMFNKHKIFREDENANAMNNNGQSKKEKQPPRRRLFEE